MTPSRLVSVSDIAGLLAERIDALVADLLPAAILEGDEYRIGSVAGEAGRSMAINRHSRRGIWCDFGAAEDMKGDALDLVAQVLFRNDKASAVAWARSWLGLDSFDLDRLPQQRRTAIARKESALHEEERKRGLAQRVFLSARPGIMGSPVEIYLRGRGIDLRGLGRQPAALRYHERLYNSESDRYWPAMVAAITGEGSSIMAVHRTWLEVQRDGRVTKAPLRDPKKSLARYAGGAIRLWRGETARPWQNVQPGEWLVIAEGIEDALSAVIAKPNFRTWAAVSLANMGGIKLREELAGVIVMAQNDKEPDAIAALER